MSNRIFLICNSHASPEHALCIGERASGSPLYEVPRDLKMRMDAFYSRHAACGDGPDHYQLAHQLTPNNDVATPQSAVAPSVRAAMVEESTHVIELDTRRK